MGKRAIYYDTETTGIKMDQDNIIELAAFDATLDQTFSELINPGVPIPPQATAIHNITDEMVADAPSLKEVALKFLEFCGTDCVLIAHNNDNFDLPFMQAEFKKIDLEFPPFETIDTLKWARKYRSDLPRHSLQHLREVFGIPPNQAHRALDDVKVLHCVFSQMIDDLTIEQVLSLLSQKEKVDVMPFGKHRGKSLADVPPSYVQWLEKSGAFERKGNEILRENFTKLGLLPA